VSRIPEYDDGYINRDAFEQAFADQPEDVEPDPGMRDLLATIDQLKAALALLLSDVEGSVDYGIPFEDPEHGFHESVMAARQALEL
jgi:hypothetical protein